MSMSSIIVQFSNGQRTLDASQLRELVDSGRVTTAMRVASLDGGKTWISVAEALASGGGTAGTGAAPASVPAESVPEDLVGEPWGKGADAGDPPYSTGWERTPTRIVGSLLEMARAKLVPAFFLSGATGFVRAGNIAVIIAAVIGFIIVCIAAGKAGSFRMFLDGLVLPVVLLVCQYIANRAIGAGERIVAHTRCSVRSRAILDISALAVLAAGLAAFAAGIAQTVDTESHPGVIHGIAALVISWHAAVLCFAPALTTTRVDHTVSAWKEAVGVMGFLGKAALRLVPVVFGVCAIVVAWHLFWETKHIVKDGAPVADIAAASAARLGGLIFLAVLPLMAYLAFIAWYALLALVESVFHCERQAAPKAQA